MSANVDNGYDRLPQHFRDHPRAYDLWQAFVLLESCASEGDDAWRFGFPASLSFPVSEIEEMRQEEDALRLDITLPGVFGPGGPLPPDFRETVIQERNEGNRVLQDFLDLLQDRLMHLWLEGAEEMCPELGRITNAPDVFPEATCPMSAAGLKMLLKKRRNINVEVEQFRGAWIDIPDSKRTRLGSNNTRIGEESILGKMVFEPCAGIAFHYFQNA